MRRKRRDKSSKSSKVVPGIMISLCALIIIYLGMTMYFKNNFYFGSVINGINVAGKTVEEVEKEISSQIDTYSLELEERQDIKEQIKAIDIGLKYDGNKIKELKDEQNSISWVSELFKKKDPVMSQVVTSPAIKSTHSLCSCNTVSTPGLWHLRLGHVSDSKLKLLST